MRNKVLVGKVGRRFGKEGKYRIYFFAAPPERIPDLFYADEASGVNLKPVTGKPTKSAVGNYFAIFGEDNMTGKFLFAERWPLEDGVFWVEDLIGCDVKDSSAGSVGRVVSVESNLPQVWLNLKNKSRNFAIPFVREIVKKVDTKRKIIFASIPEGAVVDRI